MMDRQDVYKQAYRAGWNDSIDAVLNFLGRGVNNDEEKEQLSLLSIALNDMKINPTRRINDE